MTREEKLTELARLLINQESLSEYIEYAVIPDLKKQIRELKPTKKELEELEIEDL